MGIFRLQKDNTITNDLDYLEKIYRKVKLDETVKFNGKAYRRIRPTHNKNVTYNYHFYCSRSNIYEGNILCEDYDGEMTNIVCHHKIELI